MKTKRLLTVLFVMCLCICFFAFTASAETIDSGTFGDGLTWTLDDSGTLTISGSGPMPEFDTEFNKLAGLVLRKSPWLEYRGDITALVIGEGVTTVSESTFADYRDLVSVTLPGSLISIDSHAFSCCYSLAQVELPDGLKTIGRNAFRDTAITEIRIPDSVTELGAWAFSDCNDLTKVDLGKGITRIEGYTFIDSALPQIKLHEGITYIGEQAFKACPLTEITLPTTLTETGAMAFAGTDITEVTITGNTVCGSNSFAGVETITFADGLEMIMPKALYENHVNEVHIPASVKTIGEDAFSECGSKIKFYFEGNAPECGYNPDTDPDTWDDNTILDGTTGIAYYPAGNTTWTKTFRDNCGGTMEWVSYVPEGAVTPDPETPEDPVTPDVDSSQIPNTFNVYLTMSALRAEYPEGTPWTNDQTYDWKGGVFDTGAGCMAFAFRLSDAVFDDLPARKLTEFIADQLRPGDILRLSGDTHGAIVLQNTEYGIVVAEGNYNGTVHWDRLLSFAEAESADYVLTRYPENWKEPNRLLAKQEAASLMNELTWLKKYFPDGMYWGYDYTYYWQGGMYNGSAGSYAFAMTLSDALFGDVPARKKQGMTLDQIQVGDIVVPKDGSACIVTEKLGDRVRLAEGQDGGVVNWNRMMNADEIADAMFVLTRYTATGNLEENAFYTISGLQDDYPNGTPWSNENSYTWNGIPNETGSGCFAFAYMLSDAAFGDEPARKVTDFTIDDVRSGDILVMDGYSVIVLKAYDESVMVAEGEYNGGINWGRYLYQYEVENADYMLTRYPEGYQDPVVETPEPDTSNIIDSGTCGLKGAPVYWKLTNDGTLTIYGEGPTANYHYIYQNQPWFDYRDTVTTIVVEDGVTDIGDYAFWDMSNLTKVFLPETVYELGIGCFSGCTALESVRLPMSMVKLAGSCFSGCTALKSINFPVSLRTIGDDCFNGCTSLTKVELNPGLTYVGSKAFSQCDGLVTAYVPGSITNNMQYTFAYCDALESLVLGEGLKEVGRCFADGCANLAQITFPTTLKEIGNNAFNGCGLTTLTLPTTVKVLGDWAFGGSSKLETVNINHTVEEFGNYVFSGCEALKNLNIAEGVTYAGKSTFTGCDALETVVLPGSLERVEVYMFSETYNDGPTKVILKEGITSIAKDAFYMCKQLRELHLPSTLTLIEESAFYTESNPWDPMTIYFYGTQEQWNAIEIQGSNYDLDYATIIFMEEFECTEHVYTDDADTTCNICGAERAPEASVLLGDVDNSGTVDFFDGMIVLQYYAGLIGENDLTVSAADVDNSGSIDFFDGMYILQFYAGILETLPVES